MGRFFLMVLCFSISVSLNAQSVYRSSGSSSSGRSSSYSSGTSRSSSSSSSSYGSSSFRSSSGSSGNGSSLRSVSNSGNQSSYRSNSGSGYSSSTTATRSSSNSSNQPSYGSSRSSRNSYGSSNSGNSMRSGSSSSSRSSYGSNGTSSGTLSNSSKNSQTSSTSQRRSRVYDELYNYNYSRAKKVKSINVVKSTANESSRGMEDDPRDLAVQSALRNMNLGVGESSDGKVSDDEVDVNPTKFYSELPSGSLLYNIKGQDYWLNNGTWWAKGEDGYFVVDEDYIYQNKGSKKHRKRGE